MEIKRIDPYDEAGLAAWHEVHRRSQGHGRPWGRPWQLGEFRAELRVVTPDHRLEVYAGRQGGATVCAGAISFPLADNLNAAEVQVDTDPGQRRRGHGAAMLTRLEATARSEGRSLVNVEVYHPLDDAADGNGCADVDFMTRRGYRYGLGDVHRILDLPVETVLLDRLAASAAPHHAAYRLETVVGPVPDRHLASFAVINASLMTEAPVGEVEREAENADPALLREHERLQAAQGRCAYITLALGPGDEVVAFTTVMTTEHDREAGFQWGTVVRRDHRGHRLGMAVKVANLRLLQDRAPQVTSMMTDNAEVNLHMVRVNEALGFRAVERLGELQKRL